MDSTATRIDVHDVGVMVACTLDGGCNLDVEDPMMMVVGKREETALARARRKRSLATSTQRARLSRRAAARRGLATMGKGVLKPM